MPSGQIERQLSHITKVSCDLMNYNKLWLILQDKHADAKKNSFKADCSLLNFTEFHKFGISFSMMSISKIILNVKFLACARIPNLEIIEFKQKSSGDQNLTVERLEFRKLEKLTFELATDRCFPQRY